MPQPRSPRTRSRPAERPDPTPVAAIAEALLPIPTASYREERVLDYVRDFAAARGLVCEADRAGNLFVTYRRGRVARPLVLTAHTDHPGFVVTAVRGRRLTLEFRGGLSAEYGAGERVRLFGDGTATATISSVRARPAARGAARRIAGASAMLDDGGSAAVGDLALWDVTPYRLRGSTIHARSCDDLAGAVAVLATLDRAAASGAPGHLVGLFTRAEEVGLLGAAAAAHGHLIPERAIVIAVETSSMAGGRAVRGGGPIVRVGDAQQIFSPHVSMWMTTLAAELAREDRRFTYQRKLMDGGTTEATAFALMGHETGAACIALGNYHNAGARGRVRAETVDLGDLEGLVRLFERMHGEVGRYARTLADARRRWERIGADAMRELAPRTLTPSPAPSGPLATRIAGDSREGAGSSLCSARP